MSPEILDLPGATSAFATMDVHSGSADVGEDTEAWPVRWKAGARQSEVTNGGTLAAWYGEVDRSIQNLALLQDDWDSYGAKAIDPAAVANARRIARELAMIEDVSKPAVGGTPDGEVALEWDTGEWSLDLTVDPSDQFHYVYLDRLEPNREDERYTRRLDDVLVLLTQLPRR